MAARQALVALIPNSYRYELGKLHEGIARDYPMVDLSLKTIKQAHEAINQELIARYESLRAAPGGDSALQIIYILDRFAIWLSQHSLAGNDDAYIFLAALEKHSADLFKVLRELDQEQ